MSDSWLEPISFSKLYRVAAGLNSAGSLRSLPRILLISPLIGLKMTSVIISLSAFVALLSFSFCINSVLLRISGYFENAFNNSRCQCLSIIFHHRCHVSPAALLRLCRCCIVWQCEVSFVSKEVTKSFDPTAYESWDFLCCSAGVASLEWRRLMRCFYYD